MFVLKTSPFCIPNGFGKYIISSVKIHDAILEMKFPFVFTSMDLIILTHNNIFCIKQFLSFLITHIIFTVKRLLFNLAIFTSIFFFVLLFIIIIVFFLIFFFFR